MANLIIQENGMARTTPAMHGEEITIQTPCDCSAVTGVQIAGVVYPFYDAAGNVLATGSGLFSAGNLIRVLIDKVNTRSTIINHAVTPESIGAATKTYVDEKIAAIPTPDVSKQINDHNSSTTAHSDIRTALNGKEASGTAASAVNAHNSSATAHSDIRTALNGKAPNAHAVNANTYGVGNDNVFGHVKISDKTDSTSAASAGVAASPAAVKAAYDLAKTASTAASNAQTAASSKAPMYTYGTTDLTAGSSALASGQLHFVYE